MVKPHERSLVRLQPIIVRQLPIVTAQKTSGPVAIYKEDSECAFKLGR